MQIRTLRGSLLATILLCALSPFAATAEELPVIVEAPRLPGSSLAVFLSGDGGWAALDIGVTDVLLDAGYGVIGIDAGRYFKSTKTPAQLAADLETVSRRYLEAWQRRTLLLLGYSRGADVMPFAVNALSPELGTRVEALVLIAPATYTSFTFHWADLWSNRRRDDTVETLPEAARVRSRIICLYGADEDESLCPLLRDDPRHTVIELVGGHHFDGDYGVLGQRVLQALAATDPTASPNARSGDP